MPNSSLKPDADRPPDRTSPLLHRRPYRCEHDRNGCDYALSEYAHCLRVRRVILLACVVLIDLASYVHLQNNL